MGLQTANIPFYDQLILLAKSQFLLLLVLFLLLLGSQALSENTTEDRLTLLLFKAQIHDPFGSLNSWNGTNTSLHFCNWLGVHCGNSKHDYERVTALNLASFNLTGTVSPFLANLTSLHTLNLSTNQFYSSIPSELGSLSNLQYLDLTNNSLVGEIPPSLTRCSKLRQIVLKVNHLSGKIPGNFSHCIDLDTIDFYHNQLTGSIPSSLSLLLNLKKLSLVHNQLVGGIPTSLGNLTSLTFFTLSSNQMGGQIPNELGKLTKLEIFTLAFNYFTGDIPPSLFNISSMVQIYLANNQLSGKLPNDMGINLPNLQVFQAYTNRIGSKLPLYLSNATRLQNFSVVENMFVGEIPKNLGTLQNLRNFEVSTNQLDASQPGGWDFLVALSNCSNLYTLSLSQNKLQGVLPISVANLSAQINWLDMADNNISGIIPSGIGRYSRLAMLDLSQNQFSGIIPDTIGMLQSMNKLYMFENKLHGEIPTSIGNLTQIIDLRLHMNELEGSIPSGIGRLSPFLNNLVLSYNNLNGTIPGKALSQLSSLTEFLGLSHNSFTGSLPTQIGTLINLNVLDLSDNQLSGVIPGSLGSCQLLSKLFMQGNLFEGLIPMALNGLKGMQELDLSHNNLSGLIPEFLESFQLQYLNLSFNNLEGEVPHGGVFDNVSAISVVGNSKLCGGNPELNLQPCDSTMKSHQTKAKIIIPVVVVASLLIILLAGGCYVLRQRSRANLPMPFMKVPFVQISYEKIYKATNGFSSMNLIGSGSFGSVYKAIFYSGPKRVNYAIKVLNLIQRGATKSFLAECNSLRVIRHRNIVSIVTVCSTSDQDGNDFKALILDYMPNGSLDEWLHPRMGYEKVTARSLNLIQRLNIVIDVAFALNYLHNHCHSPIVHCDLKPSNVLLDSDMGARVSDFGLSRFLSKPMSTHITDSSIGIIGSIGYIAPEYGMGAAATTQGDVYSYGVLFLETFTGKRPTSDIFQNNLNLRKYVDMAFPDQVLDIVDPLMIGDNDQGAADATSHNKWMHEFMISIFNIGLLCSRESPNERPNMMHVVNELLTLKKTLEIWTDIQGSE